MPDLGREVISTSNAEFEESDVAVRHRRQHQGSKVDVRREALADDGGS